MEQSYTGIVRFFIGVDRLKCYSPASQHYVYAKGNLGAEMVASQSMAEFQRQWLDINPDAPLKEIRMEFPIDIKINFGFWNPDFNNKSLPSPKPNHIPQHVREAMNTIAKYQEQLETEWVDISQLPYTHENYLHNDLFPITQSETWRNQSLQQLVKLSEDLQQHSLEIRKSLDKGFGLFTKEDLTQNTFLFCYTGELINMEEAKAREPNDEYMFWAGEQYKIDAIQYGNLSRFINHICDGRHSMCNVAIDCVDTEYSGFVRIIMYLKRNVKAGSELLFNYRSGKQSGFKRKILCNCPCTESHSKYEFVF